MKRPPTGSSVTSGFSINAEPEHDGGQRQRRDRQRADVVHRAAADEAQPLEPDGHGEPDADLQRDLGQARSVAVDVAAVDGVADLQKGQQHGEQDGAGIHHARRHVVAAAAQEMAGQPERRRRECRSRKAAS